MTNKTITCEDPKPCSECHYQENGKCKFDLEKDMQGIKEEMHCVTFQQRCPGKDNGKFFDMEGRN